MGPTIRTCNLAAAAALLAAVPSTAQAVPAGRSELSLFVGARAAELAGDAQRSAQLYASLAKADPASRTVANRAIAQAIIAGNMDLALRLIRSDRSNRAGVDTGLLLAADGLARGREREALAALASSAGDLSFLSPFVSAWIAAERGEESALEYLSRVPVGSGIAPYLPQHRALILLRLKRVAEAEPLIQAVLASAGGRETRLRTAFADGYLRAGARDRALQLLQGRELVLLRARERIARGKPSGAGVGTAAEAFSDLLLSLAIDLNRADARALPVAMAQIARHADRDNAQASIVLALLLAENERFDEALAALRLVPGDSIFAPQARDAEIRTLVRAERGAEALARALAFARGPDAQADAERGHG